MNNSAMNTDADLLRRYVQDRDEPAFTELVQRHVGLVYSVALRRVGGDAHFAEDVTQRVFLILARKASELSGRPTLSAWLYTSAHLTSAAVVRAERRRKTHETEAQLMQTTLSSPDSDADWTRLRPVIDDVIIALKVEDREAIALRFFEKRSFVEVGLALRVTEEAARKRVDRALDKLRALLARRGITSTVTALELALPTFAAIDSPAGLGGKVARRALAGASVPTMLSTISRTVWPAAAVLVVGTVVMIGQRQANESLRVELAERVASENALATLRTENHELAKGIATVPTSPAAGAAKASAVEIIAVTATGAIAWNNEPISWDELDHRLRQFRERQASDPRMRIHIRNLGPAFIDVPDYRAALTKVTAEVRRAEIQNVTARAFSWWF